MRLLIVILTKIGGENDKQIRQLTGELGERCFCSWKKEPPLPADFYDYLKGTEDTIDPDPRVVTWPLLEFPSRL